MKVNFNLDGVKPYGSTASKLPDGDYLVKIVGEEQTDKALVLSCLVLSGDYKGAIVKDWLNLNADKETAREIAQRRLKSIVESVGISRVSDTRELYGRPYVVSVSTRVWTRNDGTTAESNQIDGYRRYYEEPTPEPAPNPSDSNAPAIAAAGPFWGN